MKKVLIKSADEFIGSHLTEALDEYSYDFILIENL